ncbi:MAG: ABC transporter substrate-binding protein [Xanthobacteraceae bacterium]
MKRREFIALVGNVAVGVPFAARAQPAAGVRRIGVIMNLPDGDPEAKRRLDAFLKSMSKLGWNDGNNVHVDYRCGVDPQIVKRNAAELVALAPDVILANAPPTVLAVQQATRTIPVVFAGVTDPVALGLVQSLARPGGNVTGFSPAELGLSAKWLELLKEIAPALKRVAIFRAASNPGSDPQVAAIETAARSLAVQISMIDVSDTAAMERGVAAFAGSPDGGLIAIRTSEDIAVRAEIIALAQRYRLPAVYPLRFFATGGGLVAYGPDIVEEYRGAAGYVDRILKGAKPADLPVQSASKFELVINLKTVKQLGLTIPPTLLATADEVIE